MVNRTRNLESEKKGDERLLRLQVIETRNLCKKKVNGTSNRDIVHAMDRFGQVLERMVRKRGWTMVEFAERVNLNRGHISAVKNNKRKPRLEDLHKWAEILGLTGRARRDFVRSGTLEHAKQEVRELVGELDQKLDEAFKNNALIIEAMKNMSPDELKEFGRKVAEDIEKYEVD